jgi:2-keto-myo-inositol isomerase
MENPVSRRKLLATSVAGAITAPAVVGHAAEVTAERAAPVAPKPPRPDWRYCLNTATLRGQKLSLPELVDIARRAGYQAIEPWVEEIDRLVASGGSLKDLKKHIADSGLTVEGTIGFAQWCVNDPAERAKGLEEARRIMGLVSAIGGKLVAAPPAGAKDTITPQALAERYGVLLELGDQTGVVPIAEFWGPAHLMNQLGVTTQIAMDSGHPNACVLADVYHMYKGGSPFTGLNLLDGQALPVFHANDYPATPGRGEITDAHRVYPGDGIAPWPQIAASLDQIGFTGVLSLEVFNRDYWQQDPLVVAQTGLAKLKAVMEN